MVCLVSLVKFMVCLVSRLKFMMYCPTTRYSSSTGGWNCSSLGLHTVTVVPSVIEHPQVRATGKPLLYPLGDKGLLWLQNGMEICRLDRYFEHFDLKLKGVSAQVYLSTICLGYDNTCWTELDQVVIDSFLRVMKLCADIAVGYNSMGL